MKIFPALISLFFSFNLLKAQNPCNTGNCTTGLEDCPPNSTNLASSFKNAQLVLSGNGCSNGLCAGSVWRFTLVSSETAKKINATVTIDAVVNAELVSIDNELALDGNGATAQSLFVPVIRPDASLNGTDRSGYVQFSVRFFRYGINDGYSILTNLAGLRLSVYDIEGNSAGNINSGNNGSWFRETAHLKENSLSNPQIKLDNTTELSSSFFSDAGENWLGSLSALCERNDISRCSQTAMAAQYSLPQHTVTFRLGYNYNAGGNIGKPESAFGIKMSCFSFPSEIQLPVNLYDFTAKRNGNTIVLDWSTTYEQMNQGFQVQRKTGTDDFSDVGFVPSQAPGGNSQIKLNYQFTDPNSFKGISQYRIIQTDLQDKIRMSETRSVMGIDQKNSLVIYPNPGTGGKINIVFNASQLGRSVTITDFMGRMIKTWKQFTGNTLVAENLLPGIYSVRIEDLETGYIKAEKFIIGD